MPRAGPVVCERLRSLGVPLVRPANWPTAGSGCWSGTRISLGEAEAVWSFPAGDVEVRRLEALARGLAEEQPLGQRASPGGRDAGSGRDCGIQFGAPLPLFTQVPRKYRSPAS